MDGIVHFVFQSSLVDGKGKGKEKGKGKGKRKGKRKGKGVSSY